MVPYSKIAASENDTKEHRALALQAARESIVLLKNKNNFLPLKKAPAKIAVIGPDADNLDALIGNYNGTPSKPVTSSCRNPQSVSAIEVTYVQGTGLLGPVTRAIPGDALYTDDLQDEHGLKAEYFSNIKLEGAPLISRTDESVDFAWGDTGASPQL